MTGLDHVSAISIHSAAVWLVETPIEQRLRPTIPTLKDRFNLGPMDAIEAIRLADRLRQEVAHARTS